MPNLGANAVFGLACDSLGVQNLGGGAVPWWTPAVATLKATFASATPATLPARVGGVRGPTQVTTYDRGAPTWAISATSGVHLVTEPPVPSIQNQVLALPTNVTHLVLESPTNDAIDGRTPAQVQSDLTAIFANATARFPRLQAIFVMGIACIGELFTVTNGVASFSGNAAVNLATDASCDAINAAAQTTTVAAGWTFLDPRAAAAARLAALFAAPGPGNGTLTIDGRHCKAGGLDVTMSKVLTDSMTIVVPT